MSKFLLNSPPQVGLQGIVISVSVCLSVCLTVCLFAGISQKSHVQISPHFMLPVAVARCSSDGSACGTLCTSGIVDRDVHVVEVTGSPEVTSRGGAVLVIVRAESVRRRHVVLLLRYHHPVTSYIRTERLRGTLDIVVSSSHHHQHHHHHRKK